MTTHRERIQACLQGEILDQTPVALWRHFPVDDQSPETLAAAQIAYQRTYDFDLVKVSPASSFCIRDWGVEDEWRGNPEGTRQYTKHVIVQPQDWERLPARDPAARHLAGQIACLRLIRAGIGPATPMLQTIFNPLAQAKNLAGQDTLLVHLREHPEAVMKGLQTIATTTRRFIEAALDTGIDGIFYAVQHAQASLLNQAEFKKFSQDLDLSILEAAQGLWCNMLHLHGQHVYFEQVSKYPMHVINWHDRETPPSLAEAQKIFKGVLCGGLSRDVLVYKTAQDVREEREDAIRQTGGRKLILSTGCVVPVVAPYGNIMAAK
ncbi:MAG TPA: uroporphyrinogen decarboxylase family protein [Anaerolineales bacterium]|nr:uroporphyrinogen decarboxylase family protein [Anaerolineales bacterium]